MADQTVETRPAYQESAEARVHNREISENYKRLLDSALPSRERESAPVNYVAPVAYESPAPTMERPLLVHVDPHADNVARLADYTPHPAPAQQGKKILFADAVYTKGSYIGAQNAVAEPQYETLSYDYAPAYAPAYEQAPVMEDAEEDFRPTARTMQHLQRPVVEEMITAEQGVGFWAALTTKTKMLLAAVITVIVVALMIVCINTAVIGNINADIATKQLKLEQLTERSTQLEEQLANATNPDTIASWAESNGMYLAD